MSPRVFLHVGSPKTGTTFLQNVLWSQRQLARDQGLLLPLQGFHDHFHATLDVRELSGHDRYSQVEPGTWDAMVRSAEAWDGSVLISHELFAGASPEQADKACAAFSPETELHVVVTARDLVRQLPAEWQEHVKHRYPDDFEHFLTTIEADAGHETWFWTVQDVADVLDRWGHQLPRDRVHVVTVPPAGTAPTVLWTRFATLLGLEPDAFDLEQSRPNTSLGAEQAELLRRFNVALGDRLQLGAGYPGVVKEVLAHQVLSARRGTALTVPAAHRDFVLRRSEEMVTRLHDLQVDVVGDLADLVPVPEAWPDGPDPVISETVVSEEAMAALIGMAEQQRAAQRRLEDFRRETAAKVREADAVLGQVADLERRAEELQAERDQLRHDMQHRPIRHLLVGLSERWRVVMAVRLGFHRLRRGIVSAWRRLRNRPDGEIR